MADNHDCSWGHLLSTTGTTSPFRLKKKSITIGRRSDCDISFASNKLISSKHCLITQHDDGTVWLTDTSTNGTIINGQIVKGKKSKINHNDKIHLIHRKNKPEEDISYIFQDLKCLKAEPDNLDSTQEYNFDVDTAITPEIETANDARQRLRRPAASVSDELEPDAKKVKHDSCDGVSDDKSDRMSDTKPFKLDTMGEALICGICQDIFHDCLSLQPCMHSFCCSCYSQWMEKSSDCPTCRQAVKRMSRNHIVKNLVEAYLAEHPERRRPAEEIAEMDARNKITSDMIQPQNRRREYDDDDSDGDADESWNSELDESYEPSFDEDMILNSISRPDSFASLFGFGTGGGMNLRSRNRLVVPRPQPSVCRWCPGSRSGAIGSRDHGTTSTATDAVDATGQSGTSHPVCPGDMTHIMCLCCMKPMPKLENFPAPRTEETTRAQKCAVCNIFYCHLLWKCDRVGCRGCLNVFKDIAFEDSCLNHLLMNNSYESTILKNYLNGKGWTVMEFLQKCLEKLDNKQYRTTDCITKPELSSKTSLCYKCGLKNFKELAFLFRRDIPQSDLPAEVTSRPDCHWGKNCRTQINPSNPHHASRFNHVCEQTRFR